MPTPRLWTPIANAFEGYRRRVVIEPEAEYEHIWRLIHIQEALAVTLASLMATRLAYLLTGTQDSQDGDGLNVLREAVTGLRTEAVSSDDEDDVERSPWGGSTGAWIELLRRFGKTAERTEDPFLTSLASYLSSGSNRSLAFADAWARIAPVPATFRDPGLDRVGRLGAINSFRNKLAHVPVPQRLLGDLHRGLRVEVFDGLTDKFNPETDATSPGFVATSYRDPLVGILYCGRAYVTGASDVGIDASRDPEGPALKAGYGKGAAAIEWPVEPFFRIDGEAKTALLFRVTDLQREPGATGYGGEYHRFAAELEPVTYVTIAAEKISPWIPQLRAPEPEEAVAASSNEENAAVTLGGQISLAGEIILEPARSSLELRQLAEEAFLRRNYSSAAAFFDALAQTGDEQQYNDVARSKHGAAVWRAAEGNESGNDLENSLKRAVDLLRGAERHRDPRHAARSAYEGSKALWHLWRATGDNKHLLAALDAAERAVARSPAEAFISWQARVKTEVDVALPHGLSEDHSHRTAEKHADELCQLSKVHTASGRYADAASAARESIRLKPAHDGAWKQLAISLDQMGNAEEAREAWRSYNELVAQVAVDSDSESEIDNALRDARKYWSSAPTWERLAIVSNMERRGGDAITEALRVLQIHPEAHDSLLQLVNVLVNEQPEAISELLSEMRRIAPENALYIHLSGVAQRKAGHNEKALEDLRLACEYTPSNSNYWYALGRCLEDMEEFGPACDAFTKAVTCSALPHKKAQEHLKDLQASGRCTGGSHE